MMWRHTVLALLFGALALPAAAAPNLAVSPSSAAAIAAHLVVDGIATQYGPAAEASGGASGPYDNRIDVAHLNDTVAVYPSLPAQAIGVKAQDLKSEAASTGIQTDSVSTRSKASLGAISTSLEYLSFGNILVPAPVLTITGRDIHSDTSVSTVFPNSSVGMGGANIASLKIAGTLLKGLSLNYAGVPKPNTVIYDSPTMTVTLNRQIRAGIISCTPQCTFTLTMMTTDAVAITLNKAVWGSQKVSGEIDLGETNVSSP